MKKRSIQITQSGEKRRKTENKETNKNLRTLRTCGTETKRNLILITYVNRISQTKETNGRAKCVFLKIMAKTFPTLAKKEKKKKKKKPRFRLSKSQKDKLRDICSQTETKQTYNFRK